MTEISQDQSQKSQEIRPLRPGGLAVFSVLASFFAFWKLIQLFQAGLNWQILNQILPGYAAIYLAADGLLWGIMGFTLSTAVWKGSSWSRLAAQISFMIWILQQWIELLLAPDPLYFQTGWQSNLILSAAGAIIILILFNHPSSRNFFKGKLQVKPAENI
jgi:hypothetical protein